MALFPFTAHAVAQIARFKTSGLIEWLLWLFVYIIFLIGFRNRLVVMIQWAWSYVTFDRGARLITDILKEPLVETDADITMPAATWPTNNPTSCEVSPRARGEENSTIRLTDRSTLVLSCRVGKMRLEDLAMESRKVDSTAVDHQTNPQAAPGRRTNGDGVDGQAEESNVDDLVIYQPVPPRRVMRISVESRRLGRGRPLPYALDEDGEE